VSARQRPAAGTARLRLEVDWARCRGHGHCAELLPEVVRPDPWGYPILGTALEDGGGPSGLVPRSAEEAAERAVSWCPNLALRLRPTS